MNAPARQRWVTSIAGVDFLCSGLLPSPIDDHRGVYAEFRSPSGGLEIPVDVRSATIPPPRRISFRGGRTWCLSSEDASQRHLYVFGRGGLCSKRLSYGESPRDGCILETDLSLAAPELRAASPFRYPLDQLALMLALDDGLILHASAVVLDGQAFVFVGPSGAGKTTIARILSKSGAVLSDERVVIRNQGGAWTVYGTPWPSALGAARNQSAPLAGLFFLEHGTTDERHVLSREESRDLLLPCASIPFFDDHAMTHAMRFLQSLAREARSYRLKFTPTMRVEDAIRD
ncbi:MAG: hypothetical protein AAFU77_12845 [Myxococcota bacterium]